MQIKVAPSILDCDLTRLAESVAEVESGGIDFHHVDVADGHFVPNIMAGPQLTAAVVRCARLPVNVHLMISDPVRYAPSFIKAGAQSVLFHVEAVDDLPAAVEAIRARGVQVGVALKPDTPARAVVSVVGLIDYLMAMTVQPGFSGQSFMESGCEKIPELRRMFGSDIDIYVDGGIGPETAPVAVRYGANVLAASSAIFRADLRPAQAAARLKDVGQKALRDPGRAS
jgi:ribulose-phosphate 3-epimerase